MILPWLSVLKILGICLIRGQNGFESNGLIEKFAWKSLDYQFEEEWFADVAKSQKVFQPENNLPVGFEIWHEKMFITVPRWREGVPSTLNYVLLNDERRSPKLQPYPDWATNREGGDCDGVTTTYRVRADVCDRLWVLDSGAVGLSNTTKQLCPWAIHVFDLNTNKRLRKYELRKSDTNANSFVPNMVVEVGATCDDAFAYAADALGYGLVVYSWKANDSWRFEHGFFQPDPLAGEYTVGGVEYQWANEGVFGLALSPARPDGFRSLLFHPLSSHRDFYVSTEVLRNKSRVNNSYKEFHSLPSRGANGHVSTHVMDDRGVLFYNQVDSDSIACWDSGKPYVASNQMTVARDPRRLVFPSDIRLDRGTLWVMSDRMPVHLFAGLNYTEENFRVMFAPVDSLIGGTVCDPALPSSVAEDISEYDPDHVTSSPNPITLEEGFLNS